jgi:hypothetical protein
MYSPKCKTSDLIAFDGVHTMKCTPIVGNISFGEVGPGKKRINQNNGEVYYMYEVYPIKLMEHHENVYMYDEEESRTPLWVDERHIVDYHAVRNSKGFHKGWIRMGFQPDVDHDTDCVRFQRLFPDEQEYNNAPLTDPDARGYDSSSEHDDEGSLRSADSYSTLSESDSDDCTDTDDSFIVEDVVECTATAEFGTETKPCVCEFCTDMAKSSKDFDQKWHPEEGSIASHVKQIISNIESKYT